MKTLQLLPSTSLHTLREGLRQRNDIVINFLNHLLIGDGNN
ncbi:MAG: hypothetical protein V7L22_15815 [Nostoc sp.]